LIGVPKEIKVDEYRVAVTPTTIRELSRRGHRVLVERAAGVGAGISDQEYMAAGAEIVGDPAQIFPDAELIVKVKEPLASERRHLREGQIIFTYLHLAADI
jgi:alanine dehydrogenase